jgi:hypothetical protein
LKVERKKKRRNFTQGSTETQRAQRREKIRREDGHDVSCPYGVMIFCYDYA